MPIAGISYNIMKSLQDYKNFTFAITHDGYKNMRQNPNGTWNGFIGALISDQAEVAFFLSNTLERNAYLDFSPHIIYVELIFFTSLPLVRIKWQAIVYPLESKLWALVSFTILISIPIFYFKLKLQNQYCRGNIKSILYISFALPLTPMLNQCQRIPAGVRHLSTIFLFFSIMIMTCFTSNLMVYLTFPETDPVPTTPLELAEMQDFEIEIIHFAGTMSDIMFRNSTDPVLSGIGGRLNRIAIKARKESIIRTALSKKSTLINYKHVGELDSAETMSIREGFEPLKMSRVNFFSTPVSIVLKKYSKHTVVLSHQLKLLEQTGHIKRWYKDVVSISKTSCFNRLKVLRNSEDSHFYHQLHQLMEVQDSFSKLKPFSLGHFTVAFGIFIMGSIIAGLSFCIENLKN
ncbi:unnamed protein product [Allacma fusca]|uniref:Ionotropic receptor n=1 Tax=Allacma fusca TaxID=39272 RepID=A0A8J2L7M7_9HEXA|nr:unnamed protein product [Allacma fusca]